MIEERKERIRNNNGSMEPNETEIRVHVETKITDEERSIIDELKALMIRNETEENLPFEKVDQWKLGDVTKKVNTGIRHIETDDISQKANLLWQPTWVAKEIGIKKNKKGEKEEPSWQRRFKSDIPNLRRDINRRERKDKEKLEGKKRDRLRN